MKRYFPLFILLISACSTNPAIIKPKHGEPFNTDVYLIGHIVDNSHNITPVVTNVYPKTVSDSGKFTDERDGQIYKWIKIGSQVWMVQNVNYKTKIHSWAYNNSEDNAKHYGRLYSFDALLEACPKGWHVPTDTEWMLLERDMGMKYDETGQLGSRGNIAPKFLPGDAMGFDVLFGGYYKTDAFADQGRSAYFWSSTGYGAPIANRVFKSGKKGIYRNTVDREQGLSLRCVKDYWKN